MRASPSFITNIASLPRQLHIATISHGPPDHTLAHLAHLVTLPPCHLPALPRFARHAILIQAPKKADKVLDEDDLAFKEKQVGGAASPQASAASISPMRLVLATSHVQALAGQPIADHACGTTMADHACAEEGSGGAEGAQG
jgi:hypothetical protein